MTGNAAELFVRCLANEGVKYIFRIPVEENLNLSLRSMLVPRAIEYNRYEEPELADLRSGRKRSRSTRSL